MSNYSEFLKNQKEKDMNFFFGEGNWEKTSNKYFEFKRVLNNDEIIIVTNNVKMIKGNYVLLVDNNKVIYLKDWQIRKIHNFYQEIDCYVVKLNRKYFKTYTFSFNFEDYAFEKEETFDSLLEAAKEQEILNTDFAWGWMG